MYKCGIFTQASVKAILHKKRSRKCQVSQKRGNSSVGKTQPCRKIIRFPTLARKCDTKEKIRKNAEIAQLVEHNLAKVGVASSSLVFRSKVIAQVAEW